MKMKKSIFGLVLSGVLGLMLVGCAPSEINNPWNGKSIDLLQDTQMITVSSSGEKNIKVSIKPEGASETCEGSFEMYNSRSGIPLFIGALKSYKGSFNKVSTEACKNAIGGTGGIERFIDIRDPALFGSTLLVVCNTSSNDTLCLAANTFKISGN